MSDQQMVERIQEMLENDKVFIKENAIGFEFATVQQPGKPCLRWHLRQDRDQVYDNEINVGGVWKTIPSKISRQIAEISAPYAVMHRLSP